MSAKTDKVKTLFKQIVIVLIIIALAMPKMTVFAYVPESELEQVQEQQRQAELYEIVPYYMDHTMIAQINEFDAFSSDFFIP